MLNVLGSISRLFMHFLVYVHASDFRIYYNQEVNAIIFCIDAILTFILFMFTSQTSEYTIIRRLTQLSAGSMLS